ncbi:MAG: MlaE family ABC transporter permease [Endozoicomonas sp.]
MRSPSLRVEDDDIHNPLIFLDGSWSRSGRIPSVDPLVKILQQKQARTIRFAPGQDLQWDSCMVAFLLKSHRLCQKQGLEVNVKAFPAEVHDLLKLATAVPHHSQIEPSSAADFKRIPRQAAQWLLDFLRFTGEVSQGGCRLVMGRSSARWTDFLTFFNQAGLSALPIVTLLSFLVGMILAYLGMVQLRQFGVEVYVANLVGIGMVREMGALMTAIIMAGRTGAAYAAQLGTMQVNEEVDALTTLGMQPVDYLVMPRMLALVLTMPLLTIYSNILGMVGGGFVSLGMDVTYRMYVYQLAGAFTFADVMSGVFKSLVFGLLISFAGCHAGLRCGRSSAAVGQATTTAVVTAIVYLVVADAGLNILYFHLGI